MSLLPASNTDGCGSAAGDRSGISTGENTGTLHGQKAVRCFPISAILPENIDYFTHRRLLYEITDRPSRRSGLYHRLPDAKGWKEVDYLSEKLAKLKVKTFYVSPLGRARDTASLTLKKMNRTATEEPWLREFDARIHRPDVPEKEMISWDWLPQD